MRAQPGVAGEMSWSCVGVLPKHCIARHLGTFEWGGLVTTQVEVGSIWFYDIYDVGLVGHEERGGWCRFFWGWYHETLPSIYQ